VKNHTIKMAMLAMLALSACTPWVKSTDAGLKVRVAYLSQVHACKDVGKVTVSVLNKVLFIQRSRETVAEELETLGQNAAGEMGGDTIVALSRVVNGEQTFRVYRCKQ